MGASRNVLVTGGAGFIGSHLTELLLTSGCRVTVADDESTGSFDNLSAVRDHERLIIVQGDVMDRLLVRELVADVDEVFHLAASVGVQRIADAPIESIERNIAPVELLLSELARKQQAGHATSFFLASSSEVYGKNPKSTWTEEDDIVLGPTTYMRWSYGASKAIDEFLALAYHRQHGLPVVVGRFFNVVGPRQTGRYGMVLPRFVDRALAGKSPVVHDDGRQVRCFAHVADVCRMVVALAAQPAAVGQVFNIGSDLPVSILELAQRVLAVVDPSLAIEFQSYREAYSDDFEDVRRRVPDLTKLRAVIEVGPQQDLDSVIRDVVAWKKGLGAGA
ncbi:MAG TPA: NAD-dependent epimerase/dehydratase family protein [Lacipirellulaceae bacterium]|jgi:UDP-glucose 4-epimerase